MEKENDVRFAYGNFGTRYLNNEYIPSCLDDLSEEEDLNSHKRRREDFLWDHGRAPYWVVHQLRKGFDKPKPLSYGTNKGINYTTVNEAWLMVIEEDVV